MGAATTPLHVDGFHGPRVGATRAGARCAEVQGGASRGEGWAGSLLAPMAATPLRPFAQKAPPRRPGARAGAMAASSGQQAPHEAARRRR
mmetsp:Transcript_100271/g.288065  ORF Transcript_100271/g.288065 Transcript_100271/m.288065 type:complete len:90 (-) Transcript_100271:65-334(-)